MAAKKTTKKSSPKTARKPRGPSASSKSSYILSHPLDAAASAVVEAGKAAGHVFSNEYVHQVRSAAKRAGRAVKKAVAPGGVANRAEKALEKLAAKGVAAVKETVAPKRGPGRPRKAAGNEGPHGLVAGGSLEHQFAALAVELGVSRAEAILRRVREVLSKLTF